MEDEEGGRVLGQRKGMDERSCDRRPEILVSRCQIDCDSSLEVQECIPDFHRHFRQFISSTNIF